MQHTHTTKLVTASVCALGLWMGASIVMTTTVSADDGSSATTQPAAETSAEPSSTHYTVQRGDYLDAIAKEHNINWPSIYEMNQTITNPDLIYPSQELTIPSQDVPLTRGVAGTDKAISSGYDPKPSAPTQKSTVKTKAGDGYSATTSPKTMTSAGVPGLSQVVGRPYVSGGTSLAGFDCSGLTQYLAALRGISLPRTASSQYYATHRIGLADLQPGDLVFFNTNHVGMYIGGNQVVHATNPAQGVRIDDLQSAIKYNGYWGAGALGR